MSRFFIDNDKIYISLISSYNLYEDTGYTTATINGEEAKVIKHVKEGEEYYCVKIKNLAYNYSVFKWKQIILNPASKPFIWPVDIFEISESGKSELYLVYPIKYMPKMDSVSTLSKDAKFLGLENPRIKDIVFNLIDAFDSLYRKYYRYIGFDDDNIFVSQEDNSIVLPFMDFICDSLDEEVILYVENYYSEVVDPYSYKKRAIDGKDIYKDMISFDFYSEMYSFASILFRLLIGLYPYEGILMGGSVNALISENNTSWITKYVENPIFIFDSNDTSNAVGIFNQYKKNVARWNSLSQEVKDMFTNSLVTSNVMRENGKVVYYTPDQWRDALSKMEFCLKDN